MDKKQKNFKKNKPRKYSWVGKILGVSALALIITASKSDKTVRATIKCSTLLYGTIDSDMSDSDR